MNKNIAILIISLTLLITNVKPVLADNNILINEFVIEPAQSVEILNNGETSVDISNWYIDDSGGSTYYTIPENTIIYPNSCIIFSSNFYLNKSSSDTIYLFDNTSTPLLSSAVIIDSYSYALSPGEGKSYMRVPDGENIWETGIETLGKFNTTNMSCIVLPTNTPTLIPTPEVSPIALTLTPIPTDIQIDYENIYVSEVMVNPEKGNYEWVEIYNNNDFYVYLNNWYIDDEENQGSSPRIFSLNIPAKSYKVFELTSSIFNNSGDSIRLLNLNRAEKDSIYYSKSISGKTIGKISIYENETCMQEPSKERENNSCMENNKLENTPTPTNIQAFNISPSVSPSNLKAINNSENSSYERYPAGSYNISQKAKKEDGGNELKDISGEILGESINLQTNKPNTLLNGLLFCSLFLSFLTIVLIFFKIKEYIKNSKHIQRSYIFKHFKNN